ncbi:MAG: sugar phosphate isomerase/epimerase [Lachnospiraceae bacterium]|nr:sugar phosphate isomerase/epimerase [Lachnospiraceae bacterium]
MERKLGIYLNCLPATPIPERMKKIKDAGFETFFSFPNSREEVMLIREEAEKNGLFYESIHAPFTNINTLWCPGVDCMQIKKRIYESIDLASEAGVPIVVLHVSSGWFPPQLSDIGFQRYDGFVEYAADKNVIIAFENLRKFGNLAALMERYEKVDHVKFCYDFGHEHCYTETVHFTDIYGPKIVYTHIHDNHGRDHNDYWGDPDEHLMIFDGNTDFADIMARLNRLDYRGSLTLELTKDRQYAEMKDEEYLKIAYERLVKLSRL